MTVSFGGVGKFSQSWMNFLCLLSSRSRIVCPSGNSHLLAIFELWSYSIGCADM